MALVDINVTQAHIDRYGGLVSSPTDCPIYYAARDAGLNVNDVDFHQIYLLVESGARLAIDLPPIATEWQASVSDETERLWSRGKDELYPFSFTIEVPDA